MKKLILATFLALAVGPFATSHASVAVVNFTGGTLNFPDGFDLPFTVGFTFSPTADITVTHLGIWDVNEDGLADRHEIGIWDSGGALLLQDLIPDGTTATLIDGFRYIDSAALNLLAGQTYTIGVNMLRSPTADQYIFAPSSVTTDALITFGQGVRSADLSGFAFPDLFPNSGRFGPNFMFDVREVSVPEPSTLGLMLAALAFGGLSASRRRRQ